MAHWAVTERSATIKLACQAFGISQTCYRYKAKLDAENVLIADWLVRLTNNQRNWGFGLCFLYLRIKPRHRLVREKPLPLAVPTEINQSWSMDFMHDQLATGAASGCSTSSTTTTARASVSRLTSRCRPNA